MRPAASSSQCSKPALRLPRRPIPTLDEQKLMPSLGHVFNLRWLDPCKSLVSILWKFGKREILRTSC
ncbi:hypothetical protein [Burkholderia pyrrocinia]